MSQFATYPSLKDKVVLITGGAEGIGAACVENFCRQGSKVCFFDISEESARATIDKVKEDGNEPPIFYQCDVTDLKQLKDQAEAVLKEHGPVHILVNNAASAASASRVPTLELTEDTFNFGVNVNLRHMMFLTQYIVPSMQKNGYGSIVNMGSINWRIPSVGLPVYATVKAGVVGMTMTHSKEFGKDNIRVNSVAPGAIATQRQIDEVLTEEYKQECLDSQSLKRILYPDEIARLVLFLSSDDASAITGVSYVADGGWVNNVG